MTLNWIKKIPLIVGGILILLSIFFLLKREYNKKDKTDVEPSSESVQKSKKLTYSEMYTLTSTPETHIVPVGYTYELSDGGKPYYHQADDEEKEVWGGTGYHGIRPNTQYFTLSKHESEGAENVVIATFTPNK